jgi:hypothetical protein
MKIIRDYEKYIEDDSNEFRRSSKKNSFKKMKRENMFEEADRSFDRKRTDKKK